MIRRLLIILLLAVPCQAEKLNTSSPAGQSNMDSNTPINDLSPGLLEDLAELAPAWKGEVIAKVDQSYAGWDVEIGDADNDGKNEIVTTGCPGSRLYLFKKVAGAWQTRLLAEDLAHRSPKPGLGLAVRVVDLNLDGKNELILGTGQENSSPAEPAFFYILQTDGTKLTKQIFSRPTLNGSSYTHNLAFFDLDADGVLETISAYCGSGEVVRYDTDKDLSQIQARKIYKCSASGEDSLIADVDNDGKVEYITCNSYGKDQAKVEIFEFDEKGELVLPPRIVIDGTPEEKCFDCAVEAGDVDNDGNIELIVGWKTKPWQSGINNGTIIAYRVDNNQARPAYTLARNDKDLDLGYFEKMMCIADADNDGKNELVVSTRGEPPWKGAGLGHVIMFKVEFDGKIQKTLLVNFHQGKADACWPAVGDADNDGKNEIVIATGVGDRTRAGISAVVIVEKK